MKQTRIIMGMPIIIEIIDENVTGKTFDRLFSFFEYVDNTFSTYKLTSEIMKINRGKIEEKDYSADMKEILKLAQDTKKETNGYFDILYNGSIDPSGIVKGWAIQKASDMVTMEGFRNFYVSAGRDMQISGHNKKGNDWKVGIRNPFNPSEIVKVIYIHSSAVATSGIYERGNHIYNPKQTEKDRSDIVSLTVISPGILDADRFATAAFAMGTEGIAFIERKADLEGYMIDKNGIATYTSGFDKYTHAKN